MLLQNNTLSANCIDIILHELAIRVDDQLIVPSENGKQFHDDVSLLNDCSISDVM